MSRLTSFLANKMALFSVGFAIFTPMSFAENSIKSPAQLLDTTKQAQQVESQHNKNRTEQFLATEHQLKDQLAQLTLEVALLESQIDELSDRFTLNEKTLVEKEQQLRLASSSLGELFGVVRQAAKDLQREQAVTFQGSAQQRHKQLVDDIVDARTLPSKEQLYGLWQAFIAQTTSSGELEKLELPVVQANGEVITQPVVRLGTIGLGNQQGYLHWNKHRELATPYALQPKWPLNLAVLADDNKAAPSHYQLLDIDVSRGELLTQLTNTPTMMDRINSGGIIGQIIIAILGIGLFVGIVQGSFLMICRRRIRRQLTQITTPSADNPLGRILALYHQDRSNNVEALELRLLEGVMEEQARLERGLSFIKLLAALAPMLGLLGTVTGMIETFQTITQFGNADPKIMAGGISMALVTTVLGLIAAMPLLLTHNLLSSQAESIRNSIEKQGIGLVAERAEQDMVAAVRVE